MRKTGVLIGRGTFFIMLVIVALLAACTQQPATLPPQADVTEEAGVAEEPAAETPAEGMAEETTPAAEATEGTPAAEATEGTPGAEATEGTPAAGVVDQPAAPLSHQLFIGSDGQLGPESIDVDPGTMAELAFANLSEQEATVNIGMGTGSTGFTLPAAVREEGAAGLTFNPQTILVQFDEPGTYEISCVSGCDGTVMINAGQAEATPEATAEATPEATVEGEAAVEPTAAATEPVEATPEATAVAAEPTAAPAEPTATTPAEPTATTPAEPTEAPAEPTEAPADTNGGAAAVSGDAAAGEALFNQALLRTSGGVAAGCVTCHYVEADLGDFTGPNLAGIAESAATRVPGQSAVEYLRNSIVNPNDYINEGFGAGIMPQNYSEVLTEEEINDLVAYLMTLQ